MAPESINDPHFTTEGESEVLTQEKITTKLPPLYRVLLLNDDYTPMDFVIWVLESIFYKSHEEATKLMWDVHTKGSGLCGVYPHDIARTKVFQVSSAAKKNGHPLEAILEAEE